MRIKPRNFVMPENSKDWVDTCDNDGYLIIGCICLIIMISFIVMSGILHYSEFSIYSVISVFIVVCGFCLALQYDCSVNYYFWSLSFFDSPRIVFTKYYRKTKSGKKKFVYGGWIKPGDILVFDNNYFENNYNIRIPGDGNVLLTRNICTLSGYFNTQYLNNVFDGVNLSRGDLVSKEDNKKESYLEVKIDRVENPKIFNLWY